MSGHSKWATIKRKKSVLDLKKGKIFSKIAREIIVAVKAGGGVPENNPRLKLAILKSRQYGMPGKNVESAIKRGLGAETKQDYTQVRYEGYGPLGVALMIDCLTDNKNRTVADVRAVLGKRGGSLGEAGCVGWQFVDQGCIVVRFIDREDADELLQLAVEAGAQDVEKEEDAFVIVTEPKHFTKVLEFFREKQKNKLEVVHAEITMAPTSFVEVKKEEGELIENIISALEEIDDVQTVSSNYRVVV